MLDASLYGPFYLNFLLITTLLTSLVYMQAAGSGNDTKLFNLGMTFFTVFFVAIFLGTRPINGEYFVDMRSYAVIYEGAQLTGNIERSDWVFAIFVKFLSSFAPVEFFFLLCVIIYLVPSTVAATRIHGYWGFAVIISLLGGLMSYPYIVNGIRNGMATSLVLLLFSFRKNKLAMTLLGILAFGMHKSVGLPIFAFILAGIFPNLLFPVVIWLAFFAVSAIGGAGFTQYVGTFLTFGEDVRLANYTSIDSLTGMGKAGFRLDFITYSVLPIILSFHFSRPEIKQDSFYRRMLSTYLLSNSVWLLVIYSEFSNRFAYLSWFMLPWLTIYPFLPSRESMSRRPHTLLAPALLINFAFTYFMYLYYKN